MEKVEVFRKISKEREELNERINNLNRFIESDKLYETSSKHRESLLIQLSGMITYLGALDQRITILRDEIDREIGENTPILGDWCLMWDEGEIDSPVIRKYELDEIDLFDNVIKASDSLVGEIKKEIDLTKKKIETIVKKGE